MLSTIRRASSGLLRCAGFASERRLAAVRMRISRPVARLVPPDAVVFAGEADFGQRAADLDDVGSSEPSSLRYAQGGAKIERRD